MTQFVTADLQKWIREQTAAGHTRETLFNSMASHGWNVDMARDSLAAVLDVREPHDAVASSSAVPADPSSTFERLRVPSLALEGSPLYLDGGDRRVAVLGVVKSPPITVLGGLLSDEECVELVEAARPLMKRSNVLNMNNGGEKIDNARTSNGMFFRRGQTDLVTRIESRIARLLGWPVENGEGLQVLQYGPGAEYKPHYDYFDPTQPGVAPVLQRGGQRVGTLLMYLSEPARGGGTVFPDVGLEVGPRRGHGVFFSYDQPNPASRSLHGGTPVLEGEKWIATKWLREREFPI